VRGYPHPPTPKVARAPPSPLKGEGKQSLRCCENRRTNSTAVDDPTPFRFMRAGIVFPFSTRQDAWRLRTACNLPYRLVAPGYVESPIFRKKVQSGIGQVVMNLPCQLRPITGSVVAIPQRWNDNISRRADSPAGVFSVPDVSGEIACIRSVIIRPYPMIVARHRSRSFDASDTPNELRDVRRCPATARVDRRIAASRL
jgi:hypothetical protein